MWKRKGVATPDYVTARSSGGGGGGGGGGGRPMLLQRQVLDSLNTISLLVH